MAEQVAFVVSAMTVCHHRELVYGEPLTARTWIRDFRRGMLTRREVRLMDSAGPVADATQHWVHVGTGGQDASGRFTAISGPVRASEALVSSFPADATIEPSVVLPPVDTPLEGPVHAYAFTAWHTWMDVLAHVNHPAYLDWCDEGTARVLAAAGIDPHGLAPVAGRLRFKSGVVGGTAVTVQTWIEGRTAAGDVAIGHRIVGQEEKMVATATTIRRLARSDAERLESALQQPATST